MMASEDGLAREVLVVADADVDADVVDEPRRAIMRIVVGRISSSLMVVVTF